MAAIVDLFSQSGVVDGQRELLEVVGRSGRVGGFPDLLNGGKQQADQNSDDRDHDQQFDQRERASRALGRLGLAGGPRHVALQFQHRTLQE